MNLYSSRWAPRTWRSRGQQQPTTTDSSSLGTSRADGTDYKPALELSKHKKLLRRLKWKSHLLIVSHERVTHAMQQAPSVGTPGPSATEAETMFKLDFFEFYVLLERVLLHLLAVFNISVSPHVMAENSDSAAKTATTKDDVPVNGTPIIGSSNYDRSFTHRFHANVLQALDRPSNPLHVVLGTGAVREYLGIAKESRNRWKDAEEEEEEEEAQGIIGGAIPDHRALKHQRMLKNVDLEAMLACILEALDKAQSIAEENVRTGGTRRNGSLEAEVMMEYDMEDAPLEVMPDAMEWEEF